MKSIWDCVNIHIYMNKSIQKQQKTSFCPVLGVTFIPSFNCVKAKTQRNRPQNIYMFFVCFNATAPEDVRQHQSASPQNTPDLLPQRPGDQNNNLQRGRTQMLSESLDTALSHKNAKMSQTSNFESTTHCFFFLFVFVRLLKVNFKLKVS